MWHVEDLGSKQLWFVALCGMLKILALTPESLLHPESKEISLLMLLRQGYLQISWRPQCWLGLRGIRTSHCARGSASMARLSTRQCPMARPKPVGSQPRSCSPRPASPSTAIVGAMVGSLSQLGGGGAL